MPAPVKAPYNTAPPPELLLDELEELEELDELLEELELDELDELLELDDPQALKHVSAEQVAESVQPHED